MSLPNWVKRESRKRFSALGNATKAKLRIERTPDLETLRLRALHDAKGQIIRQGCTYRSTGETHWIVRRSISGRIDQFDFIANRRLKLTGGPRRFPACFRPVVGPWGISLNSDPISPT